MSKFDQFLIRFILRWHPPQSVGSFSLDDPANNYAFIHVYDDHPSLDGERMHIFRIENGTIIGKKGSGETVEDVELPISEFKNPAYKVILHKKGWNLHYSSLLEAAIDLVGWFYVRRFTQAMYDRRLTEYDDQIGLLQAATANKKARLLSEDDSIVEIISGNVHISRDAIMRRLYGNKIILSPMYYPYYKLLEHSIFAWIDSGEMAPASENNPGSTKFGLTPKALNTLAEHQLNMRKHHDSVRPAKIAAGAAISCVRRRRRTTDNNQPDCRRAVRSVAEHVTEKENALAGRRL